MRRGDGFKKRGENKTPKHNSRTLAVNEWGTFSRREATLVQRTAASSVFPWHKGDIVSLRRKEKNAAFGFCDLVCSYGPTSFWMWSLGTKDSKSVGVYIHSKAISSKSGLTEPALGRAAAIRHPEGPQNTEHTKDDILLLGGFILTLCVKVCACMCVYAPRTCIVQGSQTVASDP